MQNYKIKIGIEPAGKHEKAKQDFLQALKSYVELTPQQKERLTKEIIETANMTAVYHLIKQCLGWQ